MELDGYEILVGDTVHDIVFGNGKVERLVPDEKRFWVNHGGGSLRSYNDKGFGNFKERTLFWKNPITIIPHKHDDAWDKTVEISHLVGKALGRKT